MKIALLSTWFPPFVTGSGNRFYEVGKRLASRHDVHVFTTGVGESEMDGMYIHRYGMHNNNNSYKSVEKDSFALNLKFSLSVLKNLEIFKNFDIIDCNIVSKTLPYVSYIISKYTNAPLIETWHEAWHKQHFKEYPIFLAIPGFYIEKSIPKLSDFNIAVSDTTKNRLIDLLNVHPDKITTISNGVDLKKFNHSSVDKKYGRILYVGRLETHKCIDNLLFTYYRLKNKYEFIELILIGKGPQKEYLQKLANTLDLKDVEFIDNISYDVLITLFKSSWTLVLPSIREGQGIVLLEAMAAGTPPIAVKAEGSAVGDIVKNNYNGLLVPIDQMFYAIEKLLIDLDLHKNLIKNGLEFIKDYDWNKTAENIAKIYDTLR